MVFKFQINGPFGGGEDDLDFMFCPGDFVNVCCVLEISEVGGRGTLRMNWSRKCWATWWRRRCQSGLCTSLNEWNFSTPMLVLSQQNILVCSRLRFLTNSVLPFLQNFSYDLLPTQNTSRCPPALSEYRFWRASVTWAARADMRANSSLLSVSCC